MKNKAIAVFALFGFLAFSFSAATFAQEDLTKVKGGHQLGETAEQFFSEGHEKDALTTCSASELKKVDRATKKKVKEICEHLADSREQAISGKHTDFTPAPDPKDQREDTFTFEGDRLVKVQLIYTAPNLENNFKGRSYEEISKGMNQSYGPPSSESSEQTQDPYGVQYTAHHETWLTPEAEVLLTEHPGQRTTTSLVAYTRAEYDRTMTGTNPKITNPLK